MNEPLVVESVDRGPRNLLRLASTLLILSAIANILASLVILMLLVNSRVQNAPSVLPQSGSESFQLGQRAAPLLDFGIVAVPMFLIAPFQLLGGIKSRSASNYPVAVVSAILCFYPCNFACVIGFPLGVAALALLLSAKVRRLFDTMP